ncbi:MAG: DNA-binding protein [Candidatus Terraquivivens tikiterensis]|uniref:DNA-binding protein n=1 Tax=Candidatus Terraquivivens tikiterensis TaxID=1980982 RepID=A0A2R7Y6B0_9ARCH|nr:MAG: DNA-binding protein [Candidatus Terraquivivens tikiterensis]
MSFEEAELLKERAELFLENARQLIERGIYDLAAFNIEQYCQLILKHKLLVRTGTYPRTHSLTKLVNELSRLASSMDILINKEEYFLMLTRIEDAYIGSRYLPRRYNKIEVEAMYKFVIEVMRPLVERI